MRVVCARGEWHKVGRPRVLATFVRDDDPVTADYRDPGTGRGWRALRDGGTDPYQRAAPIPMGERVRAYRDAPPVTFDVERSHLDCQRCAYLLSESLPLLPGGLGDPRAGHLEDCARWSAVCPCGWPTWNVPVRLMAPLLEEASGKGRDVGAEDVEAVSWGWPGTTWNDDRQPHGGQDAPDDKEIRAHLRAADRGTPPGGLAPGTRGLVPVGVVAVMERQQDYHPTAAVRAVTVAYDPDDVYRPGDGVRLPGGWKAVEGVGRGEDGRLHLKADHRVQFRAGQLVEVCEDLRSRGVRTVHLGDLAPAVLQASGA